MDSHEHDDSNNKKVEEDDFFADCENDLNGFSQNNNFVTENEAADTKVRIVCRARFIVWLCFFQITNDTSTARFIRG